jgi:hypothetical protein
MMRKKVRKIGLEADFLEKGLYAVHGRVPELGIDIPRPGILYKTNENGDVLDSEGVEMIESDKKTIALRNAIELENSNIRKAYENNLEYKGVSYRS